MKNNNGFTLVEIISIIVLLGIIVIITVPNIMNASKNTKAKTLMTKVDNIEQAAILYGQDRKENFTSNCDAEVEVCEGITGECVCYKDKITVANLVDPDDNGDLSDGYIKIDGTTDTGINFISNPTDETKYLNDCEIQIYKKYGKIYAIYLARDTLNETCWFK